MSIFSEVRTALREGTLVVLNDYFPTAASKNSGIIYSHTNGTEPNKPYVVIQMGSLKQVDRTSYSTFADSQENLTIINHYEIMAQFSFVGSLAGDMAFDFQNAVSNNVVMWEAFQKFNLAPIRKSTLRRVPALRETKWIEYQNLDVTFSYAVKTTQKVDVVEHIRIVYKDDGNPDTEETLYIPPLTN